ncbi:MAG: chemotaxis protein, partial [Bdellovibrionales bacterium RIFOXYB2_FULL_36_6]
KAAVGFIKKTLRFCDGNYVWVQDSELKMVVHPTKPRLDGQPVKDNKDPDGLLLFVEFDKKAKVAAKGGWVNHKWTKPRAEKPTAKTSFVKKCGGKLGWIAGAGIWLEDL